MNRSLIWEDCIDKSLLEEENEGRQHHESFGTGSHGERREDTSGRTSETHLLASRTLARRSTSPATASFMNVTLWEENYYVAKETGRWNRRGGKEKSLWWITLLVGQPCNVFGHSPNSPKTSVIVMIPPFILLLPSFCHLWRVGWEDCKGSDT